MESTADKQVALVMSAAQSAGIALTASEATLLCQHLDFVLVANQQARLTAIESFDQGIRLHILDSLLALEEVQGAPPGPMVDMGTGGGFPGIPLSVVSKRPVDLVDSVAKKVRLVQQFLDQHPDSLAGSRTLPVRMEHIPEHMPVGGYAVALARALSALPALVELAAPCLAAGGRLIALKGDLQNEELQRGDQVATIVGLERVSLRRYQLGSGGEARAVVVYAKTGKSKIKLPRREGMAQRKPLA